MKTSNKDRLYIRLSSSENRFTWLLKSDIKTVAQGNETDFVLPAASLSVCVMVPSTFVLFREVRLARTTRKALEWALEAFSLADPEQFHLILLRRENNVHHIAAVEHERMKQWLELLEGYGVLPDCMLPDCLALPEGTFMTIGDDYIARDKPWQGYCITLAHQPVVSRLRKTQVPLQPVEGGLATLCANLTGNRMNLLSGPYRKQSFGRIKKHFMSACMLALLMSLTLPSVYRGISADYMAWKNRQDAEDMYKTSFGERTANYSSIRQSLDALRIRQKTHSFIGATNRYAPLLTLLGSDISVLTWSPKKQQLILVLDHPVTREYLNENQQESVTLSPDGLTVIAGMTQ